MLRSRGHIPRTLSLLHRRVVQTVPSDLSAVGPVSCAPLPTASAVPSTAHALPLPGGETNRDIRTALHGQIAAAWRKHTLPKHAHWAVGDIVPASPDSNAVFVGVGLGTNWPALHAAMEGGVFGGKVVAVRDVFDRCAERGVLGDWFGLVKDDVVAVRKEVVRGEGVTRRFVNEYVRGEEGWVLVKNDVDLIEYLHSSGFRVLPVDNKEELRGLESGEREVAVQQSTNHVLACAPTAFEFNRSAAMDNHFMRVGGNMGDLEAMGGLRRKVLTEFAGLHEMLTERKRGVGAQVHLFTHEDWHNTPDACFPNNTFSTHTDIETGSGCVLVLYPMKDETRRKERRLVQRLLTSGRYTQVYDLTREEEGKHGNGKGRFLEGTGSLVLDRVNRVAYVAESARSDLKLASMWARVMGYELVTFNAVDGEGRDIYHTNVMMSVGTRVAVVCGESILDETERGRVFGRLKESGHEVIDISMGQLQEFCGNVLELESFYGEQVMVMSTAAHEAFNQAQKEALLGGVARLVHANIATIEKVGGGGVRCTIAELH